MDPGRLGVWSAELRVAEEALAADAAAELEQLGFGAIWIPGRDHAPGLTAELFDRLELLLAATSELVVATGIMGIWNHDPAEIARRHRELTRAHSGRLLLGLGVSHPKFVDRVSAGRYRKPLAAMGGFLDDLDAAAEPLPRQGRIIAALGPRMLELARERAAGSHPYLVGPRHTAFAREILGPDRLLAPELGVILETDLGRAREIARAKIAAPYMELPNYRNNWLRQGFTEADLADGGSDRLVDELIASGSVETIGRRVAEHREAGADHVCLQLLGTGSEGPPRAAWRELAALTEG